MDHKFGKLDHQEILKLIPQKFPFLMVDSIENLIANKQAVGKKKIIREEPFFDCLYSEELIMPEVLLIESAAQVATLMILSDSVEKKKRIYVKGIKKAEFYHSVHPECDLSIDVNIIDSSKETLLVDSKLNVEDYEVANIQLKFCV